MPAPAHPLHPFGELRALLGRQHLGRVDDRLRHSLRNLVCSRDLLSAQQALDWFDAFRLGGSRAGRTSRSTSSFNLGLTQLLSPSTLAAFAYGFTLQRGELSNTWNSVPSTDGERVSEILPRLRNRHASSARHSRRPTARRARRP